MQIKILQYFFRTVDSNVIASFTKLVSDARILGFACLWLLYLQQLCFTIHESQRTFRKNEALQLKLSSSEILLGSPKAYLLKGVSRDTLCFRSVPES